jgi:hypothetical protein
MCSQQATVAEQSALCWTCLYRAVQQYRERYPTQHGVIYEEVVRNPVPRYRQLYEQLGLHWTSNVTDTIEQKAKAAPRAEKSAFVSERTNM